MNLATYSCPLCGGPADCPIGHMYLCATSGCKNGPKASDRLKPADLDAGLHPFGKPTFGAPGFPGLFHIAYILTDGNVSTTVEEYPDFIGPTPCVLSKGYLFYFDTPLLHGYTVTQPYPSKLTGLFYINAYSKVEVRHPSKSVVFTRRVP